MGFLARKDYVDKQDTSLSNRIAYKTNVTDGDDVHYDSVRVSGDYGVEIAGSDLDLKVKVDGSSIGLNSSGELEALGGSGSSGFTIVGLQTSTQSLSVSKPSSNGALGNFALSNFPSDTPSEAYLYVTGEAYEYFSVASASYASEVYYYAQDQVRIRDSSEIAYTNGIIRLNSTYYKSASVSAACETYIFSEINRLIPLTIAQYTSLKTNARLYFGQVHNTNKAVSDSLFYVRTVGIQNCLVYLIYK